MDIVIVDDDLPVCQWLNFVLEDNDKYNVISTCKSGREAYKVIIEKKPDVLITDIHMPGLSGIDLIKKIRDEQINIEIIIITNHPNFDYAKQAISMNTTEFLLKSELKREALISALDKIYKNITNVLEVTFDLSNNNATYLKNFYLQNEFYMKLNTKVITSFIDNFSFIQKICKKNNYKYFTIENKIFVIIQNNTIENLNSDVGIFAKECNVLLGVSDTINTYLAFINCVNNSIFALEYTFFTNENIVFFESIMNNAVLNRDDILKSYNEILSLVDNKNYKQALEKTNCWFYNFNNFSYVDFNWAKELCVKFSILLEVRYNKLKTETTAVGLDIKNLINVYTCNTLCEHMIQEMIYKENFNLSIRIIEATEYIKENYTKNITLVDIAEYVHISPAYFSRLFKNETNYSVTDYITNLRMEEAYHLLKNSDLTIAEISDKLGYENPNYFSRVYKKHKNESPRSARNRYIEASDIQKY